MTKQGFDGFVDVATAVTEGLAEEMVKRLGEKPVFTNGVPASFNPGYWDMCWQRDMSWSAPWCVPTLRVLSKLRSGDAIGPLELFAEAKPWTVPAPLLALKDMPLTTLKAGCMPDSWTPGTALHFVWVALPSSVAMDWAVANHLRWMLPGHWVRAITVGTH